MRSVDLDKIARDIIAGQATGGVRACAGSWCGVACA